MTKVPHPVFSALSDAETRALLGRNNVGRLCFIHRNRVAVEPVHYVLGDGWLFLRSASGTKLDAIAHDPFVAFEVDEIDGTFDWRSVVARGTIYLLPADGAPIERREFERALRALRGFIPGTLTSDDPTPMRQTVYGIHIDELTGRMAEPGTKPSTRQAVTPGGGGQRVPRVPDGF
ncbi:MAG TPA: pyridoxamine 5'-phosphate oxidase family protein [Gemmatimonadaceae bacterium]